MDDLYDWLLEKEKSTSGPVRVKDAAAWMQLRTDALIDRLVLDDRFEIKNFSIDEGNVKFYTHPSEFEVKASQKSL